MGRRHAVVIGCLVWSILGLVIAVSALPGVDDDARLPVGVASVAFPLCALGAASALRSRRDRLAGLLLLVSVATPTYFAYVVNLPALVVGVVLLVWPAVLGGSGHPSTGAPPSVVRVRGR